MISKESGGGSNSSYYLGVNNNSTFGQAYFGFNSGANEISYSFPSDLTGAWHHLCGTFDLFGLTLYLDGVVIATGGNSTAPNVNTVDLDLGYFNAGMGVSGYWHGNLDWPLIYAASLSAPDVAGLAAGTTDPGSLTPLVWFQFSEGSGTSVSSSTVGIPSGAITGAAWSSDVPVPIAAGGSSSLTADFVAYAITLGAADFVIATFFPADAVDYAVAVGAATLAVADGITADPVAYVVGIGPATFSLPTTLPASALAYTVSLGAANFKLKLPAAGITQSYIVTLSPASLTLTPILPAGAVAYVVEISDASLTSSRIMLAAGIVLATAPGPTNLDYSGGQCGVYALEGLTSMLAFLLDGAVFYLHLFTNDVHPSKTLKASDMVEPVYYGYSPQPADRWTPPALRGTVAFANVDPVIFTFASGMTPLPVRGYYVTNGPTGALLWSWRAPGPGFQFDDSHPTLVVNAVLTFPVVC